MNGRTVLITGAIDGLGRALAADLAGRGARLLVHGRDPARGAAAPGARIANVASAGQWPIDFDDVMLERSYDGSRAYAQSKLAQVMTTLELAELLRDAGVTATALHPGTYMPTKMVLHARGS